MSCSGFSSSSGRASPREYLPLCCWLLALAASVSLAGRGQSANALREIRDPNSGARWLLMRDPVHPGGPGRLIEVLDAISSGPAKPGQVSQVRAVPVIRAGNHVRVEEHTAIADAVLEGVALESAVTQASLRIRLNVGGRVVRAVALEPGRAALSPEVRRWR